MSEQITSNEREILKALLAGDDPVLDSLRQLASTWTVESREWTGSGFFTTLVVPGEPPTTTTETFLIDDVGGLIGSAEVMFILFVRENGRAALLECYSVGDDPVSEDMQVSSLRYAYSAIHPFRDLEYLRGHWATSGKKWALEDAKP